MPRLAQLDEVVAIVWGPLPDTNPYADRVKFPVSSLDMPVPPVPPLPAVVKAHKCPCWDDGCRFSYDTKPGAIQHHRSSCVYNDDSRWRCTVCDKETSKAQRCIDIHTASCDKKQQKRRDRMAARPKLTDGNFARLPELERRLITHALPTDYDGSPLAPLSKGREPAYDLTGRQPFGGREITPALIAMLKGARNHHDIEAGIRFSEAEESKDMDQLRKLIWETCVVIDGALCDKILGMKATWRSHSKHKLSIENTRPNLRHLWEYLEILPVCLQAPHLDTLGHTGAEIQHICMAMLLCFDDDPAVKKAVEAALEAHLTAVRLNLSQTPAANGVRAGTTLFGSSGSDYRCEWHRQACRLHLLHKIRSCVSDCIVADAKMNRWTDDEQAEFRMRFYAEAVTRLADLFVKQRGLCAHQYITIGCQPGANNMSIQRKRNKGPNNAHFLVTYNTNTGQFELDISNCEWIARVGQGASGYDMSRKKYLHALLHSPLPFARTEQQLAAVRAAYEACPEDED
jgi:hypothetical protein